MNDDSVDPQSMDYVIRLYRDQVNQLDSQQLAELDRLGAVIRDHMNRLNAGINTEGEARAATATASACMALVHDGHVPIGFAYVGLMKWITDAAEQLQYDWDSYD